MKFVGGKGGGSFFPVLVLPFSFPVVTCMFLDIPVQSAQEKSRNIRKRQMTLKLTEPH